MSLSGEYSVTLDRYSIPTTRFTARIKKYIAASLTNLFVYLRVKSSCNFRKRSKAQNAPIKNDCFFEFGAFCIENCQSSALIMDFASSDAHEYIWLQMNPGSEAKDDLFAS